MRPQLRSKSSWTPVGVPRRQTAILALLSAAAVLSGCTREPKVLEPRTPPAQTVPPVPVPATSVAEGYGRVVLYPTDGPMRVTARADVPFVPPGHQSVPSRTGELCRAPCVVDLPQGNYRLYMTPVSERVEAGDVDELQVGSGINYYVRAPGKYESAKAYPPLPIALAVAGIAMFVVGAALVPENTGQTGETQASGTGLGIMLGGLALSGLSGILYYDQSRAVRQDGATTFWRSPAPGGP